MTTRISSSKSCIAEALAAVRLSPAERHAAEADLEKGERLAELILEVGAALRMTLHRIERGLRSLAGLHSTR